MYKAEQPKAWLTRVLPEMQTLFPNHDYPLTEKKAPKMPLRQSSWCYLLHLHSHLTPTFLTLGETKSQHSQENIPHVPQVLEVRVWRRRRGLGAARLLC